MHFILGKSSPCSLSFLPPAAGFSLHVLPGPLAFCTCPCSCQYSVRGVVQFSHSALVYQQAVVRHNTPEPEGLAFTQPRRQQPSIATAGLAAHTEQQSNKPVLAHGATAAAAASSAVQTESEAGDPPSSSSGIDASLYVQMDFGRLARFTLEGQHLETAKVRVLLWPLSKFDRSTPCTRVFVSLFLFFSVCSLFDLPNLCAHVSFYTGTEICAGHGRWY